jgi:hypothetical protein
LISTAWTQERQPADDFACAAEATNHSKITVALVAELSSTTSALGYYNLARLDVNPQTLPVLTFIVCQS